MKEFFIIVISGITSFVIFSKIFEKLNKDNTKLYAPIEKIVNKLKKKESYGSFFLVISIVLVVGISKTFNLNNFIFGILLGMVGAFQEVIFRNENDNKKINKRNKVNNKKINQNNKKINSNNKKNINKKKKK